MHLTCPRQSQCVIVHILNTLTCFQVVKYLAGCGLQSCPMLLAKGYPDIGWNPCGGEKYLDFLRFAVFVNGLIFFFLCNISFCCILFTCPTINDILFLLQGRV